MGRKSARKKNANGSQGDPNFTESQGDEFLNHGKKNVDESQYAKAEAAYKRALEIYDIVLLDKHHRKFAIVHHNLGLNHLKQDKYQKAIYHLQKALNIWTHIKDEEGKADTLTFLGEVYISKGDLFEAEKNLNQSAEIISSVFGENHEKFAAVLNSIGSLHLKKGKLDEALKKYEQCVKILKSKYSDNHEGVANGLVSIGSVQALKGLFIEAEGNFKKALDIFKVTRGENHESVANILFNIGKVQYNKDCFDEAEDSLEKSHTILKSIFGETHEHVAEVMIDIGKIHIQRELFDKAEENYKKSLEIYEDKYGEDSVVTRNTLMDIGKLLLKMKKFDEAVESFKKFLRIGMLNGEKPLIIANAYEFIAFVKGGQKKYDEAEKCYKMSLKIRQEKLGNLDIEVCHILFCLGRMNIEKGCFTEAKNYAQSALEIRSKIPGDEKPTVDHILPLLMEASLK